MTKKLLSAIEIAGKRRSTALGYPIEDTGRRRSTTGRTSAEGFILTPQKRERASATARDDRRAFTVLAWMCRRHLDSVSRFTPFLRTGVEDVDRIIKSLMTLHGNRRQWDALGRHSRDESMRMFEACKVLTGDAGLLKVKGGKVQGIEGDRLSLPAGGASDKDLKNFGPDGIRFNVDGSRAEWCLCKRAGERGESLEFERKLPDQDLVFDGYWPERFDSNRGVSPLLTALNEAADVKESFEWLILKIKVSALFGLAFTRTSPDGIGGAFGRTDESATQTSYASAVGAAVKSRGLINLDLSPGEKVEAIESRTPHAEAITFSRELIRIVLLALDIPFSMYDSIASSFSARIADRNEYEEACEWKRDKNIECLQEIYGGWLFGLWYEQDRLGLRKAMDKAKITVEEVAAALKWMPAGRPWLDRTSEMAGHILALSVGVESIPGIAAAYGVDAYEIAQEQQAYLKAAGIPILYAQGGQVPVQQLLNNAIGGTKDGNEAGKATE